MPKKEVEPVKKFKMPGFFGVGIFGFLFLILGFGILVSYPHALWQLVDGMVENIFLSFRQPSLTSNVILITNFGYFGTILIWLLITGILAVNKQWRILSLCLWLSVGGYAFGSLIKLLVGRARPSGFALVEETLSSFPSLHALTAIVLYLTIAYMTYHYSRKFILSYLVFIIGLLFTLGIGFSRIYLGVHYFSDVLAGYIFGSGWMFLVLWVEKSICVLAKKD